MYVGFLLPCNGVSLVNSIMYSGMIAAHSILMLSFNSYFSPDLEFGELF